MEKFSTKILDVLATKDYFARHPGATQLGSDVYSSAINSVSEIIPRQRYTGQYVSNANQLSFGSQSSFFLTPGSVMNGLMLSASVVLPAYTRAPDLWLLNAIDSVELIISGSSSVQSLKINGRSHLDASLAVLSSEKVEALKRCCPYINNGAAGAITVYASVPLQLFFSSADLGSLFSLDTSTLQSQIIINVRWKQNYNIFFGDSTAAVTLPSSFNSLYMRVMDQLAIDNSFGLAQELRADPDMIYALPSTYLQSYTEIVNMSSLSTEQQITLTSMPSGNLQAILVSAVEVALEGASSTQALIHPFADFDSIRMLYNGVEIYRADTHAEIALSNASMTDKDNGAALLWRGSADASRSSAIDLFDSQPVVIMPFANDISRVLRDRRHENTRDYSGSSLQFFFTIAASTAVYDNTDPIDGATAFTNSTGNYRINFTFVNSALYEVSSQTVSLNM